MNKHVKFGGSTASRTIACPAWHGLSANLPAPPESYAAQLGTALHDILEACLNDDDLDPIAYVDTNHMGVLITLDHIQRKIDPALEAIKSLVEQYEIEYYWCEEFFQIESEVGGTADLLAVSGDGKTLIVGDFKSGDGYLVAAEENEQTLFYALMAVLCGEIVDYIRDCETIVCAIIQPTDRREEVLLTWETDFERLERFQTDLMDAIHAVRTENALEPVYGRHCTFCPAEAICPAKTQLIDEVKQMENAELVLSTALPMVEPLQNWIKAVNKLALETLQAGGDIDGYKLVEKRAIRKWTDPDAVTSKIKKMTSIKIDEAMDSKLKSPAQIEKLCKAKGRAFTQFEKYVEKVSSGYNVVCDDDNREGVLTDALTKNVAGFLLNRVT